MKQKKTHIWFFLGNGMGSLLCALHAIETAWFGVPKEKRGKCIILVTREESMYRDIVAMYSHVTILRISFKNLFRLLSIFLSTVRDAHLVLHPLSFGEHNIYFKLYSKFITMWNRESENIGAVPDTRLNRFFYSKIIPRDLTISVFELMEREVMSVLEVKKKKIDLLFQYDTALAKKLTSPYIVIHPYAANVARSLPMDRWIQIIEYVASVFDGIIIISGGPENYDEYRTLASRTTVPTQFIQNLADGKIQNIIQIISGATIFIGVDTGVTHIANILHKDCVVIGNRSNPCWLPTYNDKAVILSNPKNCTCEGDKRGGCFVTIEGVSYFRCMIDIGQDTIYATIKNMLHLKTP